MMTTIKVPAVLRDQLAKVGAEDYGGVTLAEVLRKLLDEHEERTALEAYARLQANPEEWASYQEELASVERAGIADWSREDPAA